ncbi:MAG: class I SAM-dependent methyltransferase [Chitinivibrionales bacterium]|nr:class I SAM-dependent methyltransferase [Chitinivibrionales bacterium]
MVTDIRSSYSSPAGREFTMLAGRCAAINPASRVLDLGSGYGDGACNLAREFRCKVTAIDQSEENIQSAQQLAQEKGVSHLITWEIRDIMQADFSQAEPFELALAEGGTFSFISRVRGLALVHQWLIPRGWLSFSDLIFYTEKVPPEVKTIFEDDRYHYESEQSYRALVHDAGFEVYCMTMVPPSGWDNYYAHMARRLEDEKGVFADKRIKLAFHKEIDVFYRLEGFRYVGYLFCLARKRE